jgi:hypothetical protein
MKEYDPVNRIADRLAEQIQPPRTWPRNTQAVDRKVNRPGGRTGPPARCCGDSQTIRGIRRLLMVRVGHDAKNFL